MKWPRYFHDRTTPHSPLCILVTFSIKINNRNIQYNSILIMRFSKVLQIRAIFRAISNIYLKTSACVPCLYMHFYQYVNFSIKYTFSRVILFINVHLWNKKVCTNVFRIRYIGIPITFYNSYHDPMSTHPHTHSKTHTHTLPHENWMFYFQVANLNYKKHKTFNL